jgi:NADPH2:quinone reductase
LKIGDKVCALVSGGGYAQYCNAPQEQCLPIPGELTFEEAASLPETFFTVWSNVFDRANLKPGEKFISARRLQRHWRYCYSNGKSFR